MTRVDRGHDNKSRLAVKRVQGRTAPIFIYRLMIRKDCVTDRERADRDVTSKLNEVLAEESSAIDPALRKAQARSVGSSSLPHARDYGSR